MSHEKDQSVNRREFLARLGRAGLATGPLVLGSQLAAQTSPAPPRNLRIAASNEIPTPDPGTSPSNLLRSSDFSYVGCFKMPSGAGGGDAEWGRGLTHRYVNGQLRFLAAAWAPSVSGGWSVYEVAAPGLSSSAGSAAVASVARAWGEVPGPNLVGQLHGVYWDEVDRRLYWAGGSIYNTTSSTDPSVGSATLNDSTGSYSRRGVWSFSGRSCKMTMGGVLALPDWFSSRYCPGKRLAAGFGGYFSIVTIGPVSMGPALTAFNPAQMSGSGGSVACTNLVGYPYNPSPYSNPDRCHRDTNYTNEYDHWNPRNGVGYWSWSDWLWQGAVWVDTPSKSGLIYFPTLGNGRTWYQNSTLNAQSASHAWFVYDPADLGRVAQGSTQEWQIQPKNSWSVQYPGVSYPLSGWADEPRQMVTGATYDATTGRLYVAVRFALGFASGSSQVVYAYQVL